MNTLSKNSQAHFVSNNRIKNATVLKELQLELLKCDNFSMSVAFITLEGITMILQQLSELREKGIKGRILTSTYQLFNAPEVYKKLLNIDNIEVRVYSQEIHHTKGYIFEKGEKKSVIIGSSNLTASALKINREWNLKLEDIEDSRMIDKVYDEFNEMWSRASTLTNDWIAEYEVDYLKSIELKGVISPQKQERIYPNIMQREALKNLETLRAEGKQKALLISATGTGKTYLSAFDVRNFKARKTLFIIHREQIARDAMTTFRKVMPELTTGLLTGSEKSYDADIIFATIQSLSKKETYTKFARDHFDYIIFDEVHRAGADSYQGIQDYFEPMFKLGMSATPERNDDKNIYEMFDYNIAYEIRLKEALEEKMLTPFHYFGITEASIDGDIVGDDANIFRLINPQRVALIIEKMKYYGYSGNRVKGLIFCGRNEEAILLSKEMNRQGLRTLALSGINSQVDREAAIARLVDKDGDLDYILTVDIFNEGVDIPKINQIVMLRPTQSAIIFVQQLGRGLRKHSSKEYVVVIDFIGNYKNNFMIPIALSGDNSYNKNTLRKYVMEGNSLTPGVSTVEFDRVAKERIYNAINKGDYNKRTSLKKEYDNLKYRLGKIPTLVDFHENNSIDPTVIFSGNWRNYHMFKSAVDKEYRVSFTNFENGFLTFVSSEVSIGKRKIELEMLKDLLHNGSFKVQNYILIYGQMSTKSALRILNLEFFTQLERSKYDENEFVVIDEDRVSLSKTLRDSLTDLIFYKEVMDVIEYGLLRNSARYEVGDYLDLVVGEQYTRKDACWLLNFKSNQMGTVYGYKVDDYSKTIPLFVTYNKADDIEDSIMYHDYFINRETFNWMSRNNRTLESNEIKKLIKGYEEGYAIVLFVKRSDGEKSDFYYLGQVDIESSENSHMKVKEKNVPVVEFILKLRHTVKDDLYYYLTES